MARKSIVLDRQQREHISKIVTFAHICIWSVCALIALVFARLTLKDIPFGPALSNTNPQYFQAILLSIYIWCWAIGTSIDTHFQSTIYLVDPLGGQVRLGSVVAVIGLALISSILLWVRFNELQFALALAAFTTVDILTWLYLRHKFLPPIVQATQKKYEKEPPDYYGQLLLKAVVSQVAGNWKWWRQIFLSAIVALMIGAAVLPNVNDVIARALAITIPIVSADAMKPLVQDFLLLAFLLISEVWHFAFRLRTFLTTRIIDKLETNYLIRPRKMSPQGWVSAEGE